MGTPPKIYAPMTVTEAEQFLYTEVHETVAEIVDTMDDTSKLIYAEVISLHKRIDEIENQASDMMSPERMTEIASSFLGGTGGR